MLTKRVSLTFFTSITFLAVFLFTNNASAITQPQAGCQNCRSMPGCTVIRDTPNDCLIREQGGGGYADTHFYISGGQFCTEMTSSHLGRMDAGCWPTTGQQPTQPTAPDVQVVRAIEVTKGKPVHEDLSKELLALFNPEDRTSPQIYSYTLDTMGGFPPMGLILKSNGILEGTPTGKDSSFRACATNVSGKKVCKVIEVDVQSEETDEPELNPDKLTELAYEGLTLKQQMRSGIRERVMIKMPDGLVAMDKNSIFTPVSESEVKTDEGRFRFDYQPTTGGDRKVVARDATLRVKGTEFLVDTDKFGTNIVVIEGLLSVSDAKGKKTIEVAGGQYAYIKKGGLPTVSQSFDSSQVDRWWEEKNEEKTSEQDNQMIVRIIRIVIAVIILLPIIIILIIIMLFKKIFRKK